MKSVYVETSLVSYLTARPSRDVVVAARQQLTLEWWDRRRRDFELLTSQLVVDEAAQGDAAMARQRLALLDSMTLLQVSDEAERIAEAIVADGLLPSRAFVDALHIGVATAHRLDYLLTWNCAHIANAEILPRIAATFRRLDLAMPFICTPEELLGEVPS